jgi:hypothetical protein
LVTRARWRYLRDQEGSIGDSLAYYTWDNLQVAELKLAEELVGEPGPVGEPQPVGGEPEPIGGEPGPVGGGPGPVGGEPELKDYCSSCNQRRPVLDFGRFLTCITCRQHNTKANRRRAKAYKAIVRPHATQEQIREHLEDWVMVAGEYNLKPYSRSRRLTVDNYLN